MSILKKENQKDCDTLSPVFIYKNLLKFFFKDNSDETQKFIRRNVVCLIKTLMETER